MCAELADVSIIFFSSLSQNTELVRNPTLQRDCQAFVCTNPTTAGSPLPIPEIVRLYAACRPDVTLADVFITQKEKMDQVDPRR